MIVLGVTSASITILANYLILRDHFTPLIEFRRAVEAIHGGMSPSIVERTILIPLLEGLSVRSAMFLTDWRTNRYGTLLCF